MDCKLLGLINENAKLIVIRASGRTCHLPERLVGKTVVTDSPTSQ